MRLREIQVGAEYRVSLPGGAVVVATVARIMPPRHEGDRRVIRARWQRADGEVLLSAFAPADLLGRADRA